MFYLTLKIEKLVMDNSKPGRKDWVDWRIENKTLYYDFFSKNIKLLQKNYLRLISKVTHSLKKLVYLNHKILFGTLRCTAN